MARFFVRKNVNAPISWTLSGWRSFWAGMNQRVSEGKRGNASERLPSCVNSWESSCYPGSNVGYIPALIFAERCERPERFLVPALLMLMPPWYHFSHQLAHCFFFRKASPILIIFPILWTCSSTAYVLFPSTKPPSWRERLSILLSPYPLNHVRSPFKNGSPL